MDIIQKTTAAPAAGDPLDYVMSDSTVDRLGDVIEADGWQLNNFKNNPIALFGHDSHFIVGNWGNVRVESNRLVGRLDLLPPVSERLQEIHAAINGGMLRAVSVGFRPVQTEPIPDSKVGGIRFIKSELVECSLVAVPANPNALQIAKDLKLSRDTISLIFGKTADKVQEIASESIGKPAGTHGSSRKPPMSLSDKIEASQTRLTSLKDQLTEHNGKDGVDETPDEQHLTMGEELTQRINTELRHLEMLRASEVALGSKSEPVAAVTTTAVTTQSHRPFALPKKEVKPADYVFRSITAMLLQHITKQPMREVLRQHYGDDEPTHRVAEALVMRAATVPATTTLSGWAAQLVQTSVADFIDLLFPQSVYPGLSARGGRFTFGRNGIVSLPSRVATPTIAGAFIAEGAPIPVKQGAFTAITLTPKKMGVISAFTRQIAEHSTPAIEQQIRVMMQEDTAVSLDTILLDATAADTTRPAGLRSGVAGLTPTAGGGFNALVGDIKQLVGVLTAANSLRAPVWIMNPVDVLSLTLVQNAGGDFPFKAEVNGGTFQGYPILQSTTQTVHTVILVDAADFFSATGDEPRFDVSDQAVLHMEDTTPLPISTTGTAAVVAAPVRSLWQTDSIAIRMMLDVNWAMRRTGVVAWVAAVTW